MKAVIMTFIYINRKSNVWCTSFSFASEAHFQIPGWILVSCCHPCILHIQAI